MFDVASGPSFSEKIMVASLPEARKSTIFFKRNNGWFPSQRLGSPPYFSRETLGGFLARGSEVHHIFQEKHLVASSPEARKSTIFFKRKIWWRWRESNPRARISKQEPLHVYPDLYLLPRASTGGIPLEQPLSILPDTPKAKEDRTILL